MASACRCRTGLRNAWLKTAAGCYIEVFARALAPFEASIHRRVNVWRMSFRFRAQLWASLPVDARVLAALGGQHAADENHNANAHTCTTGDVRTNSLQSDQIGDGFVRTSADQWDLVVL